MAGVKAAKAAAAGGGDSNGSQRRWHGPAEQLALVNEMAAAKLCWQRRMAARSQNPNLAIASAEPRVRASASACQLAAAHRLAEQCLMMSTISDENIQVSKRNRVAWRNLLSGISRHVLSTHICNGVVVGSRL